MGNLLVAGKCISATFRAQSAARGIGPCMVGGQGAGTAAALAIREEVSDIHDINTKQLRKILKSQGVLFAS